MDSATLELTRRWFVRASRDLATARKLAAGDDPYLDTAIYHCQQAAEKAVKGLLTFHAIRFEKVHNIQLLITQALSVAPTLTEWLDAAEELTPYATAYRYPGEELEPDRAEFDTAIDAAEGLYKTILQRLPVETHP